MEDDFYLSLLLEKPFSKELDENRCQGPNADSLISGKIIDEEDISNTFEYLDINSKIQVDENVIAIMPRRVVQPTVVRLGASRYCPRTPLSEKSVSAYLEDGSSSVSSFSTLLSNITSPDSTKVAKFVLSKESSAFRTLNYFQKAIFPELRSVPPVRAFNTQ